VGIGVDFGVDRYGKGGECQKFIDFTNSTHVICAQSVGIKSLVRGAAMMGENYD